MPAEDAEALTNYLFLQLGYVLTNLDSENMNEDFLKKVKK